MKIICGKLKLNINIEDKWKIPKNVVKFMDGKVSEDILYKVQFVENFNNDNEIIKFEREDLVVTENNKCLESRYFRIPGFSYPYAVYREEDERNISIYIHKDFDGNFTLDSLFWSLFSLERHMIKKESIILHCSYIVYKDKAILFSGPSGIGKSTQANLWEKYNKAKIINGDRALLVKGYDGWYVYGWPMCGSSKICLNEKNKLGAIVFLGKSKENQILKLGKIDIIKNIISQTTINYWNEDFVSKAITLMDNIANNIDVYKLVCTPDINAVNILENKLMENEMWIL